MLRTSPKRSPRRSARLQGKKPEIEEIKNFSAYEKFLRQQAKGKRKVKTPSPKIDSDDSDADFFTASPSSSPGSFYTASPSPKYTPPKPVLDRIVKRLTPPKGPTFLQQIQKGPGKLRHVSPKKRKSPDNNLLAAIKGVKLRPIVKRRKSPKKLSPKSQAILARRQYIESPSPTPSPRRSRSPKRRSRSPKRKSPSPKRRKSRSPKRLILSPGTLRSVKLKKRTSPKRKVSPKVSAFDKIKFMGPNEDNSGW